MSTRHLFFCCLQARIIEFMCDFKFEKEKDDSVETQKFNVSKNIYHIYLFTYNTSYCHWNIATNYEIRQSYIIIFIQQVLSCKHYNWILIPKRFHDNGKTDIHNSKRSIFYAEFICLQRWIYGQWTIYQPLDFSSLFLIID